MLFRSSGVGAPGLEDALTSSGVVLLPVPPGAPSLRSVQVSLRVQEAEVALLGADGLPLARGRCELGYLKRPGA